MSSNAVQSENPIIVDAVVTNFNESYEKINITLTSCINQSFPFRKIYLVDDGSTEFNPGLLIQHHLIEVIQLPFNMGISAARNKAVALSNAEYIACINVEIELATNWVEFLLQSFCNPTVTPISAVFCKLLVNQRSNVSSWRLRFHEQQYPINSGIAEFAPGHAVIFRKSFIDQINGFNENYKLVHEDAEICYRLKDLGTIIYYNAEVAIISHQSNNLNLLCKKHLIRMTVGQGKKLPLLKFIKILCIDHCNRFFRNLVKGRWSFLIIDLQVSYNCYKYFRS